MEFVEQKLQGLDVVGGGANDECGVKEDISKDERKAGLFEHLTTKENAVGNVADHDDETAEHESDNEVEQTASDEKDEKDGPDSEYDDYWDPDEQPPLNLHYEALKHIADHFLPGAHGACTNITTLERGGWHEIRVLHFEDGWSCIGRFTREAEPLHKTESELATMEYVRKHTSIKVPEVYYVNYNENHVVGAPFLLIERLDGKPLGLYWENLSLDHKLSVIEQLAGVYGELASLKFDRIGSLKSDGSVGPLIDQAEWWHPLAEQPFETTEEYLYSYIKEDNINRTEEARALYPAIKYELHSFLAQRASDPTLNAPYRLIHGDWSPRNVLVTQDKSTNPPKISGVIDWEWSYTGPLYYLCEHPNELLIDDDSTPEFRAETKALRKRFASTLAHHFPKDSADRELVRRCFREKNYLMSFYEADFIKSGWNADMEEMIAEDWLKAVRDTSRKASPYDNSDWQPDTESESEDDV